MEKKIKAVTKASLQASIDTKKMLLLVTSLLIILFLPFLINQQSLTLRQGDASELAWPDYFFIRQSILSVHQLPWWNPTLFSGIPEIANPQSPLIYPINFIALILPLDLGIVILNILHLFIGGIYLYLLCIRVFKWSALSSTVATFCFVFSPYFFGKIAVGHFSQIFAIYFLPVIAYYGLRLFNKYSLKKLFLLSIFLSFQYLNYPTVWYYTVFFGMTAAFLGAVLFHKKKFVITALSAVIGSLLLIFPVFLSQFLAGPLTTRANLRFEDLALPLWNLKRFLTSLLVPSNFLNDSETEVWLYPAISCLILAFLGFWKLKRKYKILVIFLLLLVLSITAGASTFMFKLLTSYFPGFNYLRIVTRDFFIFIFLIALLAGYFIESVKDKKKIFFAAILVADLLFFSALRLWFVPASMQSYSGLNLTRLLNHLDPQYRYYCTNRCLSASVTVPRELKMADGYHPIILKNYQEQLSMAGGFNVEGYTTNLPSYQHAEAQPSATKLGNFAVKWVISNHQLGDKNFKKIDEANGYTLYENLAALKRIRFKEQLGNSINILEDTPNKIIVETDGKEDILIVADSFFPGWYATIDGEQTEISLENSWARAIVVPGGKNLIVMEYIPFRLIADKILSR